MFSNYTWLGFAALRFAALSVHILTQLFGQVINWHCLASRMWSQNLNPGQSDSKTCVLYAIMYCLHIYFQPIFSGIFRTLQTFIYLFAMLVACGSS